MYYRFSQIQMHHLFQQSILVSANEGCLRYQSFKVAIIGVVDEVTDFTLKVRVYTHVYVFDANCEMLPQFGKIFALFLENSYVIIDDIRKPLKTALSMHPKDL